MFAWQGEDGKKVREGSGFRVQGSEVTPSHTLRAARGNQAGTRPLEVLNPEP
jgi:hypothetical protein